MRRRSPRSSSRSRASPLPEAGEPSWPPLAPNPVREYFSGLLSKCAGANVHYAGDTAYFSAFEEIGRRLNPDVALLPIAGYEPPALREDRMSPLDAVQAFVDLGAKLLVLATVYSDRGQGVRAPVVFYKRSNEAGAQLKPGDFDWNAIFKNGIRWFHSGGIFATLSETTGEVIIEGMQAAKRAGAICSFDLNFREKLWNLWGGAAKAQEIIGRIVAHADVLVGNEEDLQKGLGIKGQDVEKESKLNASAFFAMMGEVAARLPHVKMVATTMREVHSTNHHTWGAVAWMAGKTYVSPTCELGFYDRVGGGEGFASGLIYGLLSGESVETALKLGWAHGALLTTTPGDTTMVTLEQVKSFASGGSARIQR